MVNFSGPVRDYEVEKDRDLKKIKKYGVVTLAAILIKISFLIVKSLIEVPDAIHAAGISVCIGIVVFSLVTVAKMIGYINKYFLSLIPTAEGE